MEKEIPDFNSWLELEAVKTVVALKDGTVLMVLKKFRKKADNGKWQTGVSMSFFGQEVFRSWNIFVDKEELVFGAIKTEEGKWEIGVPIFKDEPGPANSGGTFSSHTDGEQNPYIELSIVTIHGRITRTVYKNGPPPR